MRKIKCIISIMLVLFICFQSFAAVVSEMDGSAFITKEEFENMKNEFAYQIEQYNKSIDDKIDGAISQYLKGIRLASKTSYNLIMKSTSLKNVNFMNGTIATTYKIPNSKFVYDITFSNTKEYGAGSGYRCHGGIHVTRILKYDNGLKNTNNTNNKYLLALKDKESEGSASSYVWDGIAIQYIEWVNSTLSCFGAFGWLDWIDANEPYRHTIQLRYPTCLIGTGYNANIRDQILNNNLKVYYTNNRSGASSLFENWANRVASNSMYVELGKVNNLDRTHKCLISYTNDIKYKGHLETATNTLTEDSANPLTDASILNSSETLLNTGIHVAYNANNSNMYNNGQYAATTPQSTTQTGNYRISTVGYLGE